MAKNILDAMFDDEGNKDTGTKGGRTQRKSKRGRQGFASMDPEKQRKIASKGGRAAHRKGTAHEWTTEEARAAGRIGGNIGPQKYCRGSQTSFT